MAPIQRKPQAKKPTSHPKPISTHTRHPRRRLTARRCSECSQMTEDISRHMVESHPCLTGTGTRHNCYFGCPFFNKDEGVAMIHYDSNKHFDTLRIVCGDKLKVYRPEDPNTVIEVDCPLRISDPGNMNRHVKKVHGRVWSEGAYIAKVIGLADGPRAVGEFKELVAAAFAEIATDAPSQATQSTPQFTSEPEPFFAESLSFTPEPEAFTSEPEAFTSEQKIVGYGSSLEPAPAPSAPLVTKPRKPFRMRTRGLSLFVDTSVANTLPFTPNLCSSPLSSPLPPLTADPSSAVSSNFFFSPCSSASDYCGDFAFPSFDSSRCSTPDSSYPNTPLQGGLNALSPFQEHINVYSPDDAKKCFWFPEEPESAKDTYNGGLQLSVPQINVLDAEGVPSPDDVWTVPVDFFDGALASQLPTTEFGSHGFALNVEPCGGGVDYFPDAATPQVNEPSALCDGGVGYTGMATAQRPAGVHSPLTVELSLPFTNLGLASRTPSPVQPDNGYIDSTSPSSSATPNGHYGISSPSSSPMHHTSALSSPVQSGPPSPFMGSYDLPFIDSANRIPYPMPVPCVGTPSSTPSPSHMAPYNVPTSPIPLLRPSSQGHSPPPQIRMARSLPPLPTQSYLSQPTPSMSQQPWLASSTPLSFTPDSPSSSPIQSSSRTIPSQILKKSNFGEHTSDPPQIAPLPVDPSFNLNGYMNWLGGVVPADNELDELIATSMAGGLDVWGLS